MFVFAVVSQQSIWFIGASNINNKTITLPQMRELIIIERRGIYAN
jgi:hypothetical protein